ncbi:MAG TPA: MarR family transcriptional regulator [Micromonospora sp.]|nr:MarR family transcriptional regulator [Micromonospora sp.]
MTENMLDDPRITAVGLFLEAHTGLMTRFAAQLHEHRLSPVEFDVLMRLARSPAQQLRMTDLAAQTSLSTSGVTRLVDRMERDGLLTRRSCPSDRRISYAVLTPAGRRRLDEALPGHLTLIEQWFTGQLTPEALAALLGALRKVRDAVNPCATAGSGNQTACDETPAQGRRTVSPVTGRGRGR